MHGSYLSPVNTPGDLKVTLLQNGKWPLAREFISESLLVLHSA
jgi:hypothetical protein